VLPEAERAFPASSPEVRRLLVELVGKLEDRRASKLLLAALGDPDPRVRSEAARTLGDGAFPEAVRPLMAAKSGDSEPEVRQAAARALKKLAPR
jgi:HEAT repeat protein